MKNDIKISCPSCKHEFNPGHALEQVVRAELDTEYQARIQQEASRLEEEIRIKTTKEVDEKIQESQRLLQSVNAERESLKSQADMIRAARQKVAEQEKSLTEKEVELEKIVAQRIEVAQADVESKALARFEAEFKRKEQELKEKNQSLETQYLQQVNKEVERIQTLNDLKVRELNKKLQDQGEMLEEMKRKHEQGSMQLQGEVAELFIEDLLRSSFPEDEIQPVPKGLQGADSIQVVRNQFRKDCGKIIYESKRTKHFSAEWIDKLKSDARAMNCEVSVLVTEALPKDITKFTFIDGVWVCTFNEVRSVAMILRQGLIRAGELIAAQENKADKMQVLYDYLSSNQFRGCVEGIVEAFSALREGIDKEKRVQYKLWAEREKQLEKVILNTSAMYGSIKGISGSAVADVPGLEYDQKL